MASHEASHTLCSWPLFRLLVASQLEASPTRGLTRGFLRLWPPLRPPYRLFQHVFFQVVISKRLRARSKDRFLIDQAKQKKSINNRSTTSRVAKQKNKPLHTTPAQLSSLLLPSRLTNVTSTTQIFSSFSQHMKRKRRGGLWHYRVRYIYSLVNALIACFHECSTILHLTNTKLGYVS